MKRLLFFLFLFCSTALNASYSSESLSTDCKSPDLICSVVPTSVWSFSATNLSVTFTDQSVGIPTFWLWDFGDGNISTQQNPSHTYATPGTYTVCLTVSNSDGADSTCQSVVVACPDPVSDWSNSVSNLDAAFTDLSTGGVTFWLWDFGDGNTSTQQNPDHTYASPGTYTVCLTVTNNCGADSSCQTVQIFSIGIRENSPIEIRAYPNPASDFVYFEVSGLSEDIPIQILDATGRIVWNGILFPTNVQVSLQELMPGTYIVRIGDQLVRVMKR